MPKETCIKCGHINDQYTGAQTEACPKCGVIYAKARAVATGGSPTPRRAKPTTHAYAQVSFVDVLRSESVYPTFRSVVTIMSVLGYLAGALIIIAAVVAMTRDLSKGISGGVIVFGAIVIVATRVFKEMSLMLADMSDATIRMAERQEKD